MTKLTNIRQRVAQPFRDVLVRPDPESQRLYELGSTLGPALWSEEARASETAKYVGLSEYEAEVALREAGRMMRVVGRDGVQREVKSDARFNRLNVDVCDGVVVAGEWG